MVCAANTDFYIEPDKAGIVDGMIPLQIYCHLHSIPFGLEVLQLSCL